MDDITPASSQKETTDTSVSSEPVMAPTPESPAPAPAADDQAVEKTIESPQVPEEQVADTGLPQAADAQKKHGSMPLVIILVVLVVLGLSAAAYLAFAKKDDTTSKNTNTQPQATQTAAEASATSDPDEATKAIDTALSSTDETKDYSANDLSDTTLGL